MSLTLEVDEEGSFHRNVQTFRARVRMCAFPHKLYTQNCVRTLLCTHIPRILLQRQATSDIIRLLRYACAKFLHRAAIRSDRVHRTMTANIRTCVPKSVHYTRIKYRVLVETCVGGSITRACERAHRRQTCCRQHMNATMLLPQQRQRRRPVKCATWATKTQKQTRSRQTVVTRGLCCSVQENYNAKVLGCLLLLLLLMVLHKLQNVSLSYVLLLLLHVQYSRKICPLMLWALCENGVECFIVICINHQHP